MSESGPSIEALTHRLVQTPQAMLAEPDQQVDVNAVLADLLRDLAGAHVAEAVAWRASSRNEARLSLLAAWVLADPWFVQRAPRFAAAAKTLLCGGLQAVSKLVDASRFVSDGDRREELARRVLAALQLLPESESEAVAADRLRTLDSVERHRVMAATRRRQERMREVREALRRKVAEEAAAKVARE